VSSSITILHFSTDTVVFCWLVSFLLNTFSSGLSRRVIAVELCNKCQIFLIRRFNLDLLACKKIYMHAYRSGFFVRVVYRVVHVAHRVDEAVRIDIAVPLRSETACSPSWATLLIMSSLHMPSSPFHTTRGLTDKTFLLNAIICCIDAANTRRWWVLQVLQVIRFLIISCLTSLLSWWIWLAIEWRRFLLRCANTRKTHHIQYHRRNNDFFRKNKSSNSVNIRRKRTPYCGSTLQAPKFVNYEV
jgi:hypothetical protein